MFCENRHFFAGRKFWNTAWNLTFCPFFCQKASKKQNVPFKITVTFSENCRFSAVGFSWHSYRNLTFMPFFGQKTSKKTRCTLYKNRYVLWKSSLFSGLFFLKLCLKSQLLSFFLVKAQLKTKLYRFLVPAGTPRTCFPAVADALFNRHE